MSGESDDGIPISVPEQAAFRARLRDAEQRLREVEGRYALATSAALEGIYEWDLAAGRLVLTDRAKEFFALADGDLTPAAWNALIHPDDFAGYQAAIVDHFKGRAPHLEHEYRIVDAAGGYRWILDRGVGVRDANGRVTKVVGAVSDITRRKLAEIEVARARDRAQEALEQQTAMAAILRVISGSPTSVQPVFDTIAAAALKLCSAATGLVFTFDGSLIHLAAMANLNPDAADAWARAFPRPPSRETAAARAILTASVVAIPDVRDDPEYAMGAIAATTGFRSALAVPLMREGKPIGAVGVGRAEAGPFSTTQIALLQTFADQAIIAIENTRLFRELEVKSRELEAASRHKSEFLANMSHELRTPLNAIIGFSEVLAERMFGEINDRQAEYLADILESGRHLLALINDILDLSKIEAGRMELEAGDFDLPTAIENTLVLVRERAQRRGIALGHSVDARLGAIRADERKVKQVLLNLLSNALKFTPEGGRIDVRAEVRDGMAEIAVTDTGVGIAPEDQEAVFEEFRQVGMASKKVEGTGLGLAISRKFVELHGGTMRVASRVGGGSTFTFTLPLAPRAAPD